MNKLILLGRLVKDPDICYTQTNSGELAITNFRIAVNRKYAKENGPNADFFTCTAFGKKAEFVSNYFAKGAKIAVEGRMENDNYENNQGEKVYSVRLMVDDVDFADSKGEEAGEDRSSGRRAETGTRRSSSEANGRRNTAASKSRESEQRGCSTSRTAARATASASRTSNPQRRSTASRISKLAALCLYDFCQKVKIPICIYGHCTDGWEHINLADEIVYLRSCAEFEPEKNDRLRIIHLKADGRNRDGAALWYLGNQLLLRPEKHKLLFLISDGLPNSNYYAGGQAVEDLKQIKNKLVKKGIVFQAAAIGCDKEQIRQIYGNAYLDISDLEQLPKILNRQIAKLLRRNG